MQTCVCKTLATCKHFCAKHLPHTNICVQNTCHMQTILCKTLATCKHFCAKYLPHANIAVKNTSHMQTFVCKTLTTSKHLCAKHLPHANICVQSKNTQAERSEDCCVKENYKENDTVFRKRFSGKQRFAI